MQKKAKPCGICQKKLEQRAFLLCGECRRAFELRVYGPASEKDAGLSDEEIIAVWSAARARRATLRRWAEEQAARDSELGIQLRALVMKLGKKHTALREEMILMIHEAGLI